MDVNSTSTTLSEILGSPVGSFAFVLAIMAAIIWVVFYVTRFVTKISVKHDGFKEESDRTRVHIDEIRKDLAVVKGNIEAAISIRDALTKRRSPVSLSEDGAKIAEEYKFDEMIARNWEKILTTTYDLESKNPYDLQEYFIETTYLEPNNFFLERDVDGLKTVAYKCGYSFMSIARVVGILIRDAYFAHKGISVDEVDKYDPHK